VFAITGFDIQILPAVGAKTLAIRLAQRASRQCQQHLLPHDVLQLQAALSIIPYFRLIFGNGALTRLGIRALRPKQQVELALQRNRPS
jgi:hypothetical protein